MEIKFKKMVVNMLFLKKKKYLNNNQRAFCFWETLRFIKSDSEQFLIYLILFYTRFYRWPKNNVILM